MPSNAEASGGPDAPLRLGRRGTFLPNILSNGFNLCISIVLGLWFTPYLIRNLGTGLYGLIPLATSVTNYVAILAFGLNTSVGRYLTIALEKNDVVTANRVFNSAVFGTLLLIGIMLFPLGALAFFADKVVSVPAGHESDARLLFAFSAIVLVLSVLRNPFVCSAYCRNRFDIQNLIDALQNIGRVALVVLVFHFFTPRIWQVGLSAVMVIFMGLVAYVFVWRHLTPVLHFSRRDVHRKTLRKLSSTSSWVIVGQVGGMLLLGIDLLIVNRLFGADSAGRYAVVLQWAALLRSLASAMAAVFGPTIIAHFAKEEIAALVQYTRRSVKFVGLLIALPVGILCGFSRPLLTVWLGPDFSDLSPLMILSLATVPVTLATTPLYSVVVAADAVRTQAVVTTILGVLNAILAIVLGGPLGWGLYGVAAAGVIVLVFRNVFFVPYYAAFILERRRGTFVRELLPVLLASVLAGALAWGAAATFALDSWFDLVLAGGSIGILFLLFAYTVLLRADERKLVVEMIAGLQTKLQSP